MLPLRLRSLLKLACLLAWFTVSAPLPCSLLQARERYTVQFASGERVETDKFPSWPLPEKPLEVARRKLFDRDNPAVLVRDRKATSQLQSAALLMTNGDVLCGLPQRLEPAVGRSGEPAWLQVQLEANLVPVDGSTLLVRADRVRRIVGRGRSLFPEPPEGTVVLSDGRQLLARSVRWREYGLAVLTEGGIVEASFADIVDAVLPATDRLQGVIEDNLWAGPEAKSLLRFTLAGGGVLTTGRVTRVEEKTRARGRQQVEIFYQVQPAWSRQAIAVNEEEIAWCAYRQPDEALLPLLPDEPLANRRLIGQSEPWRSTGVENEPVPAAGSREADIAVAVHAHSEIAFELPPAAKSLNVAVGIAQRARPGGCVVCKIVADQPDGPVLWESGFVTGADEVKESGAVDVAGHKRVVLVTEFAHEGRPAGADPLDIRDEVRWLRPTVQLDMEKLRSGESLAPLLPGLEAWQLEGVESPPVGIESVWSDVHDRWEPVLALAKGQELKLTRQVSVARSGDILELAAACPSSADEPALELTVDGEPIAPTLSREPKELRKSLESLLPRLRRRDIRESERERNFDDTLAWWWDLQAWRGKQVTLTLTIRANDRDRRLAWRGLALRSAISNLPASGDLPRVGVPLTSLEPLDLSAHKERGSPVKDALPGRRGEPIRYLGQQATGGYGMVRNSHVSFELRPEYRQFVAVVGAVSASSGPFEVLVDDKVVWHKDACDNLSPAELLQIDLPPGARQLTIVNGNDGSYGGHAGWTDAGFVTSK